MSQFEHVKRNLIRDLEVTLFQQSQMSFERSSKARQSELLFGDLVANQIVVNV